MADPQITYPSNNETGVSTTPTISWSEVTGATKYKLQVDTANTFDSSAGSPLIEDEIIGGAGLLILDSHSATYKATQKPKQWGTLSAVQSAVRHNCEEWLGVDYLRSKLILPLWNTGLMVYDFSVNLRNGVKSPAVEYTNTGIRTNSASVSFGSAPVGFIDDTLSAFVIIKSLEYASAAFLSKHGSNSYGWKFAANSTSKNNIEIAYSPNGSTWNNGVTHTPPIDIGSKHSLALVIDNNRNRLYVDGNYYISGDIPSSFSTKGINENGSNLLLGGEEFSGGRYFNSEIDVTYLFNHALNYHQASNLNEQPYRLLQSVAPVFYSIGSSTPTTSKQVTLAAGTTHYARVAADTP